MFTLNCKGKLVDLQKPLVMGILNITSDSFYKGYLQQTPETILSAVAEMIGHGAAIIDVGGQTTKPGSLMISANDELQRVLPVIKLIQQHFPAIIISVDTFYSEVASAAVAAGASIVNDVSAGNIDEQMLTTVGSLKVPYICMHMKGTPATMQKDPQYDDVVKEVLEFFIQKIDACHKAGIVDVIIDPGFGFGKTAAHNFRLLQNMSAFKILDKPILAGLSRKGMVYRTLGISAAEALNGTTVLNTLALMQGAHILRVHDVRQAVEAITLVEMYKSNA